MAKFPFHRRITRFCSMIYRPKIVGPLGGQLHVRTLYDMIIDYVLELIKIENRKFFHF